MKRLLFLMMGAILSLNSNAQNPTKQAKGNMGDPPYKIENNNLSIGNMAFAQKVLLAWKDYDNNTMDNSANLLADDVVATFPDGTMIKGRDNLIKYVKDFRNSLTSATSEVHACTTLKSPAHPEREVVTIWGMETDVLKDGTTTKTHLNEVWFFNKAGKVAEIHQMAAKEVTENK